MASKILIKVIDGYLINQFSQIQKNTNMKIKRLFIRIIAL